MEGKDDTTEEIIISPGNRHDMETRLLDIDPATRKFIENLRSTGKLTSAAEDSTKAEAPAGNVEVSHVLPGKMISAVKYKNVKKKFDALM